MVRSNRWQKKTDDNQADIVSAVVNIGGKVYDASHVGGGFPDLIVGFRGNIWLIEVKQGKRKLNKLQESFHQEWDGYCHVVRTPMEAVELLTNG